jgi:predicted P-loop ATPase
VLLDPANGISDHPLSQADPQRCVDRQIQQATNEATLSTNEKGVPYATPNNIRIALLKLGITLRFDKFAYRTMLDGLPGFGPALEDAAIDRIWLTLQRQFHLHVSEGLLCTVLTDTAQLNSFHPVLDYLDGLEWDGVERIDTWLTTYGGAQSNEYVRAVGALMLVAAVRRVRQPGCKFDEMLVLENPEQGTDKSTALSVLAGHDDWFSDDLPLSATSQKAIEMMQGRWIMEAAEMSGMRRTEIEHLKAFLSRRIDRARMAYARCVTEAPRQCVVFGTTNSSEYLRDTTGNRRFWPVLVRRFDTEALRRDRDQLWAEAVAREATGVSIRLKPELWSFAAAEQAQRLTSDPYLDALRNELGDLEEGKISSESVWVILDLKPGQRTQDQNTRMGAAMRALGWRRQNSAGTVRIEGKLVTGYVKGEQPWGHTVECKRGMYGTLDMTVTSDAAKAAAAAEFQQSIRRPSFGDEDGRAERKKREGSNTPRKKRNDINRR